MTLSQNPRLSAIQLLAESENFNDPSATWHISRQQMAKTSLVLTFVIGSATGDTFKTSTGKYISIEHYRSKGRWIQKALENQLKLNSTYAQQLAILMERSALRAAGFSEQEWQEYYEKRNNLPPGDKSWALTSQETSEIISFLKEGITINEEYCVPYYAGLSDDKKTIYFDSSTRKSLATSLDRDISFRDYVVLHERVEGAMMEQSYLDQLNNSKNQIIFEAPLNVKEENRFEKLAMRYRLVDGELKLSYEHKLCSSKKEWESIQGMDQQAIEQHVLSYEFAHQIAERLERVAIFAEYGNIWANEYNKPLMEEIERLMNEYEKLHETNASLTRPVPPDLYILPYAQEADNKIAMYLLRQVAEPKLKKYKVKQLPQSIKPSIVSFTDIFTTLPPSQKRLVLFVDINHTIIVTSTRKGTNKKTGILTLLADHYSAIWDISVTNQIMTFKDFVRNHLCAGNEHAQIEQYGNFIEYLKTKNHELLNEITIEYETISEKFSQNIDGDEIFSSFINLVYDLENNKDKTPYTLILRTFGQDLDMTVAELERRTPIKFTNRAKFDMDGFLNTDTETKKSPKEIYDVIKPFEHCAWQDNYTRWKSHHFIAGGKLFPLDLDEHVTSIFWDDNIGDDEKNILSIQLTSGDTISNRQTFEMLLRKYHSIVSINTIEAIKDHAYFIKLKNGALYQKSLKNSSKLQSIIINTNEKNQISRSRLISLSLSR